MEDDKITQDTEAAGIMDSDFIPLDALVYAPLHALAESNRQLRAQIVEAIKSMGTQRYNGNEEITHLENLNIAYDQIRQEGEDGYSVDNLQVQVPLLSIVPVANLNVDKAEINFSTEVKAELDNETKKPQITARICSPSQRESDFLPKVSYKLSIVSVPATEGILRLGDALSANQVAKRIDNTPIVLNGDLGNEEQKAIMQETKQLRAKVSKLEQLHRKITGMIEEQERLHQISKDAFDEDTHEFDKDKYLMAQSAIVNRIMECKEQIIDREILYGLERDFK
ncbi:MAG: DUF2589 domain-containing protein [Lachnospiraceae bacterium]|nr:DUF2589 domain-containing protein [Lachnospiraceae bacterium]